MLDLKDVGLVTSFVMLLEVSGTVDKMFVTMAVKVPSSLPCVCDPVQVIRDYSRESL